jgi:hypothetical protein
VNSSVVEDAARVARIVRIVRIIGLSAKGLYFIVRIVRTSANVLALFEVKCGRCGR